MGGATLFHTRIVLISKWTATWKMFRLNRKKWWFRWNDQQLHSTVCIEGCQVMTASYFRNSHQKCRQRLSYRFGCSNLTSLQYKWQSMIITGWQPKSLLWIALYIWMKISNKFFLDNGTKFHSTKIYKDSSLGHGIQFQSTNCTLKFQATAETKKSVGIMPIYTHTYWL